jgi:hypothetical protein
MHLPPNIKYEGFWWQKDQFIVDGRVPMIYKGREADAKDIAEHYCKSVATGNMSVLRRFMEASMLASRRPHNYVNKFLDHMLTQEGKKKVLTKLRRVFGTKIKPDIRAWDRYGDGKTFGLFDVRNPDLAKVVSCTMGFTRKRNLFLPEWADDQSLWKPGQ